MMLTITPSQHSRLQHWAAAAWPVEACGLLVGCGDGKDMCVTDIIPATNSLAHLPGRFEIDPATRFRVERRLREPAWSHVRLIGHYHSHPTGNPLPSATDVAMVLEPDLIWVIIACTETGAGDMKSFRFDAQKADFVEIPLVIAPPASVEPPLSPQPEPSQSIL